MAHPVRPGALAGRRSPDPPSPYLTGDMPSSAAAVNAIVGGPGREAVVAGPVPSRILKTTLGRGEKRPGVFHAPLRPSSLLPQARQNYSPSAWQPFKVTRPKIT